MNLAVAPTLGAVGAAASTNLIYIGLVTLKFVWFIRTTGAPSSAWFLLNGSDLAYVMGRVRAVVQA